MPKKWIRDARRKAREEAFHAVSSEDHALARSTLLTSSGGGLSPNVADNIAPLPIYRFNLSPRLVEIATPIKYLSSLLSWTEDTKEFLFNSQPPGTLTPVEASVLALLKTAVTTWVISSSKVRCMTSYDDLPHENDMIVVISSRLTAIHATSLEMEHDITICDVDAIGTLIAIVSTTLNPTDPASPIDQNIQSRLTQLLLTSHPAIPNHAPVFPIPPPTSPPNLYTTNIRPSDCDEVSNVLNRDYLLPLFLDAMMLHSTPSTFPLSKVSFFVLEAPILDRLLPRQSSNITISSCKWLDEDSSSLQWVAHVSNHPLRAFFTTNHSAAFTITQHVEA